MKLMRETESNKHTFLFMIWYYMIMGIVMQCWVETPQFKNPNPNEMRINC